MTKLLVTHFYPDLDGITGIWLLRRFGGKHFENSLVEFVPARHTWLDQAADSNPDIIHIDTGLGLFDHHLTDERTCATKKVFESLNLDDEALERIVDHVTAIDHFEDLTWPDPLADMYDFELDSIIIGWKAAYPERHKDYVEWGMIALDGVYRSIKNKISAEHSLSESGAEFESIWGPAIAIQAFNDEVLRVGQKMGFVVVARLDPNKHYLRIKGRSDRDDIDLTNVYNKLLALDPEATWFLHPDKKQLLNGNTKNPNNVSTKLSLDEVIELLKVV
ncbi:MAG: hypothetical protein M3P33_01450 [bacterium]|nr:hypothetical protein [bacterium]